MSKIITAYHHHIGGRQVYEDRVEVQTFRTAGGLNLDVAVVADGVGGRNRGDRASQLAVDTVFAFLRQATEADVPTILYRAAKAANQVVYSESQQQLERFQGTSTTLAIAAIQDNSRLFIANVGDSRIYLCRQNKVNQLSIDHTFANIMPIEGKLSWELARENQSADVVMYALGVRSDVPVDLGFYVNTTDPGTANARGRKGIPLEDGDSVLVCSDGLIKNDPNGQPYLTNEEMLRVVNSQEGESAARSLVSFAMGRDANDNVSVAVLQVPDPRRKRRAVMRDPKLIYGGAAVLALIVIAVVALFINASATGQVTAAGQTVTAQAQAAFAVELTATRDIALVQQAANDATGTAIAISSFTSTPTETPTVTPTPSATPTIRPTLLPDQIGVAFRGSQQELIYREQNIAAGSDFLEVQINHRGDGDDASFYLLPETTLSFDDVDEDTIDVTLFNFGDLFASNGRYVGGITLELAQVPGPQFRASDRACISLRNTETDSSTLFFTCYSGTCQYRANRADDFEEVAVGWELAFGADTDIATIEQISSPDSEAIRYRGILFQSNSGRQHIGQCLARWLPTPTFTPTPTTPPTIIPSSTATNSSSSAPPQATNTPRPATALPTTPPTATSQPPSATPVPPTATPKPTAPPPPTATSPPSPTSTRLPTSTPLPTNTIVVETIISPPCTDPNPPPTCTAPTRPP